MALLPLPAGTRLRHCGNQYQALVARIRREFGPILRRRDMLGAILYCAAARNGNEIALDEKRRAVIDRDEETGRLRLEIRRR